MAGSLTGVHPVMWSRNADRLWSATKGGIYWSFSTFSESSPQPVVITLNAVDKKTGQVLGHSRMTLGWEENNTFVGVEKIE